MWVGTIFKDRKNFSKYYIIQSNKSKEMTEILKNWKLIIFLPCLFLNFNNDSYAHIRGTFSSQEEAFKQSTKLGCEGLHKNKDKWLPCKDEKELHEYLRK